MAVAIRKFVIVYCALLLVTAAASVDGRSNQRSIVRGPLNAAVDLSINETTTTVLECEASDPPPTSRTSWTEYITNGAGAPISDNSQVLTGHPNSARYTIDWDGNTTFDLVIEPTLLQDGGAYRCIDINDPSAVKYSQIITIDGAPNCTTNIPNDGFVVEEQYYSMECNIYYQGNVAPTMIWTGPEPFAWTSTTTSTTVFSGFIVNMTRSMSEKTFDLSVNFTADGFLQDDYATNVPTLKYSKSTPELHVQWPPKNMYYTPVQETYEVGTQIECYADANPAANIFWQNIETGETWNDYRLYISDSLIGTQRMWCRSENTIGGVVYVRDLFFNLTVNPRTTTQPPTTPPTTTTPPAEAPCDELSGRWSATSPHQVEMCLAVNNTNLGRIFGLLRNETDPFFVELRGRILPYQTGQFGVTGIWPFNLEVISFVGTCKKCYGVEKMWVNAVIRTTTDNSECGDFGPTNYSQMYLFSRTGPPCIG